MFRIKLKKERRFKLKYRWSNRGCVIKIHVSRVQWHAYRWSFKYFVNADFEPALSIEHVREKSENLAKAEIAGIYWSAMAWFNRTVFRRSRKIKLLTRWSSIRSSSHTRFHFYSWYAPFSFFRNYYFYFVLFLHIISSRIKTRLHYRWNLKTKSLINWQVLMFNLKLYLRII